MASSKLMPSTSSLKSEYRRNPTKRADPKSDLYRLQSQKSVINDAENDLGTASMVSLDGFIRNATAACDGDDDNYSGEGLDRGGSVGGQNYSMDGEITLLDAAGAIMSITDADVGSQVPDTKRKKSADDVWREIVARGLNKEDRKVECKEEMMTLEDFLLKAGAVDEAELMADMNGKVKVESGLSGGEMFSFESPYMSRQGSLESVGTMWYGGDEAVGKKRRGGNLFEPLDKATQQRHKRMIKNRESAARSRERKQAYQNELESMAVRLEEENEQLLKENAERTKARRKMLMENIIPVEEKRRPARSLRRVHSMQW